MANCIDCSGGSSNTGKPTGLNKPFGIPQQLIVQSMVGSAGTANSINIATDLPTGKLTQAFLDTKVNEVEDTDRWKPVSGLEGVEAIRADNVFEEFPSGEKTLVHEGVRSFTSTLPVETRQFLGQLKNMDCSNIGVYIVDDCGNMLGNTADAGLIKPIRVSKSTWDALLMWATDSTNQNITLSYDFDRTEKDENHGYVSSADITADFANMNGLIDVTFASDTSTVGGAGTGFIEFDSEFIYGNALTKLVLKGMVVGDFTVTLNGVAEPLVSSIETPDGHYTLLLTSVLVATDVITVAATKTAYEFTTLSHIA